MDVRSLSGVLRTNRSPSLLEKTLADAETAIHRLRALAKDRLLYESVAAD